MKSRPLPSMVFSAALLAGHDSAAARQDSWSSHVNLSALRIPATGDWIIFYHRWENQTGDGPYSGARQVAVDRLKHLPDGAIAPVRMSE